jgi:UDP-N-acetylglucosamine 3-dehydrogenase
MKQLQIGIVGLGRWAEWHLQVIATMENACVSAVCSHSNERALEIARDYNVPKAYTDYRELVRDTSVDAVIVCTSEEQHCEPTLAAFENSKPVLVEKPIAHDLEDADRMINAAKKYNAILLPGHTLRFDPRYATLKDMIQDGKLGKLASIYAHRHIPNDRLSWRPTQLFMRTSVHDIDLILWYVGETPSDVCAMQSNVSDAPLPETNWILLRFPNGVIAGVATVGLVPMAAPGTLLATMEVIGTKGIINIDNTDQGISYWTDEHCRNLDLSFKTMVAGRLVGSIRNELNYFVKCINEGKRPEIVTPEEGRNAISVCLKALSVAGQYTKIVKEI